MTQCVKCDQLAQCQKDMAKAELRARKAEAEVERLERMVKDAERDLEILVNIVPQEYLDEAKTQKEQGL